MAWKRTLQLYGVLAIAAVLSALSAEDAGARHAPEPPAETVLAMSTGPAATATVDVLSAF